MTKYLLILILFASCTTAKKAAKWYEKHPDQLAVICAEKFPVKDSFYVTEFTEIDTTYFDNADIDSVHLLPDVISAIDAGVEKVTHGKYQTIMVFDTTATAVRELLRTKVITRTVRRDSVIIRTDKALLKVIDGQINSLQRDTAKLNTKVAMQKTLLKKKSKLILYLSGAILFLLLVLFRKPVLNALNPIKRFYPH